MWSLNTTDQPKQESSSGNEFVGGRKVRVITIINPLSKLGINNFFSLIDNYSYS